jgi:4-hydroxybenzoate polyprenyltransferase
MNHTTRRRVALGWMQLLRPPNLFTVPGDALAGFAMTGGLVAGRAAWLTGAGLAAAALLFYMSGLLWNDCADYAEDLRERPERPLPSGRVGRRPAFAAGLALAAGGLALAARVAGRPGLGVGAVLVALVAAYNVVLKRVPGLGEAGMGLCRGASLMLGAAAAGAAALSSARVVLAAATLCVYIAGVTAIARHETGRGPRPWMLAAPPVALLLGFGAQWGWTGGLGACAAACALAAVAWSGRLVLRLRGAGGGGRVAHAVGGLIRGLLLVQAAWLCAAPGGLPWAVAIMALWPLSAWSGRRFYAS